MFVLSLSNKIVGKTCSGILLCTGNQVTKYIPSMVNVKCRREQDPQSRGLSPLECPIKIPNSLMGDSVSTNPVQVHTRGTETSNPGNRELHTKLTVTADLLYIGPPLT